MSSVFGGLAAVSDQPESRMCTHVPLYIYIMLCTYIEDVFIYMLICIHISIVIVDIWGPMISEMRI